jgi:hypothetical protein
MKKQLLIVPVAVCMLFGASMVTSCDKEKTDEHPEVVDVTTFDQLAYLQGVLGEVDSLGNLKTYTDADGNVHPQRLYGVALSETTPDVLSVGVTDLAEAKQIFKSLFSPDVKFVESGNNITVTLTNSQGTVSFAPDDTDGAVAKVTFACEIKHVSSLTFLLKSAWSENSNGYSPFNNGDVTELGSIEGMKKWLCIRSASAGQNGILIFLSEKDYSGADHRGDAPSAGTAKEVSNILKNNWSYYKSVAANAGITRLQDNWEYWISDWKFYFVYVGQKAITLQTGNIREYDISYHNPKKATLQVKYFGLTY